LADIIATIGFRKKLIALHRSRRRAAAINYMRIRAAKIAKVEPSEVRIDPELNRILMLNAIGSASNIKVSISASAGKAEVKRFVEKTANATPQAKSTKTPDSAAKKAAVPVGKPENTKKETKADSK
jgi:ribosomal protein L31E